MNYTAIADAASAYANADDAYAAMSLETISVDKDVESRMVNERTILSLIGTADGDAFMTALEASPLVPARVKTWFKPSERGVDILEAGTQDILGLMVAGATITQSQADILTAYGRTTSPKWPGLSPGIIDTAMNMRDAYLVAVANEASLSSEVAALKPVLDAKVAEGDALRAAVDATPQAIALATYEAELNAMSSDYSLKSSELKQAIKTLATTAEV